jgi:hypothetical protein
MGTLRSDRGDPGDATRAELRRRHGVLKRFDIVDVPRQEHIASGNAQLV